MKKSKIKILNGFLETISGIADRDYQEKIWILGKGPECDDYTETICHFFDDGDPIISNYKNYEITEDQLFLLIKLRNFIENFNSNIRFKLGINFLDSSEWVNIIKVANDVLKSFSYSQINGVKNKNDSSKI